MQTGLLVLQAALSLVVLAGAGLFVRSLRNIHAVDLGMDANHIVLGAMKPPGPPTTRRRRSPSTNALSSDCRPFLVWSA